MLEKNLNTFRNLRNNGIKLKANTPDIVEEVLRKVITPGDLKYIKESIIEFLSVKITETVNTLGFDTSLNAATTYYQHEDIIQSFIERGLTRYRKTDFEEGYVESITPIIIYDDGRNSGEHTVPYNEDVIEYPRETIKERNPGKFDSNNLIVTLSVYKYSDVNGIDFTCTNVNIYIPDLLR